MGNLAAEAVMDKGIKEKHTLGGGGGGGGGGAELEV